jgi:hypothetical protein
MTKRSFAAALVLVLGAATAGSWPFPAGAVAAPEAVSATDPAHDVRIFRKAQGMRMAQRTSIDLRRVDLQPRPGDVRITVRLRKVLRTNRFDQMVFLTLTPPPGSSETWSADIGMSAQRRGLSYATLATGTGSYESCDPLRARVLRRTNQVRLDVPVGCIPEGEVSISVRSLTGYFRSDGRPWSEDRLRFGSPVVLR